MGKSIERTASVNITQDDGSENKVSIVVKSPTPKMLSDAQRKGAVVWANCIKEGVLTKDELEIILEERGIWSKSHKEKQARITQEITNIERMLFIGGNSRKMSATKGRELALSMRQKRDEMRDLMAKRLAMESNTAEALSENAKFDYLVSQCVYDENGEQYYSTHEEYSLDSNGPIAFQAAQELASMLYSLEDDFESKLPENVYLKEFKHVDDELRLINKDGNLVDSEGRTINDIGHFLNAAGERVDKDGYRLTADGMYVSEDVKVKNVEPKEVDENIPAKKTPSKKKL